MESSEKYLLPEHVNLMCEWLGLKDLVRLSMVSTTIRSYILNDDAQIKIKRPTVYFPRLGVYKKYITRLSLTLYNFRLFDPKEFPRLKYLDASGCHILSHELEKFLNIKELNLSKNPLNDISSLVNVQNLKLIDSGVKNIPTLPRLQEIEIDWNIDTISPQPSLIKATIHNESIQGERSDSIINSLLSNPKLTYLNADIIFRDMPSVQQLETLIIKSYVVKLPDFPNLTFLDLRKVIGITTLPECMPKLRTLYIDNSTVKRIPCLSALKILTLSSTDVEELPILNSLEIIDITDTFTVFDKNKLPSLKKIYIGSFGDPHPETWFGKEPHKWDVVIHKTSYHPSKPRR